MMFDFIFGAIIDAWRKLFDVVRRELGLGLAITLFAALPPLAAVAVYLIAR